MRLAILALTLAAILTGQWRVITPADAAKPVGPYSPALDLGNYVYVSGQGVRDANGGMPAAIEAQASQCIANVRANLEAAGLTLRNVAAAQLFVSDMAQLPVVERLWSEAFGPTLPPRITLGVTRMPTGTTVEITVVARRTPDQRHYFNAIYGQTRRQAEKKLAEALRSAGLGPKHIAMANWYTTGEPAPGVINVAALPGNARWAVFAVAAKKKQSATIFCEVVSSTGSGTVAQQTSDAFEKLKSCLAKGGATLAQLVSTNVYIDNMDNFAEMNAAYAAVFQPPFPTRTTIQPVPPTQAAGIAVRISGIAEKR